MSDKVKATEAGDSRAEELIIKDVQISDLKAVNSNCNSYNVKNLTESIKHIGLLNPIHITPTGEVISGWHRIEAAKLLGKTTIKAVVKTYDTITQELAKIDENIIRRKLSVVERGDLLIRRNELLESLGLRAKAGDNQHTKKQKGLMTTKEIAKKGGMERSAQLAVHIAKRIPASVKAKLKNTPIANNVTALHDLSKITSNQQEKVVNMLEKNAGRDAVVRAIKDVKREENIKVIHKDASSFASNGDVQLHTGDFREICKGIPDNSIDAIVTDPPYPKEYLGLWKDLGVMANRVLRPGGFLVAYTGKVYLPMVIQSLCDAGLEYVWLFTIVFEGNKNPVSHHRGIHELSRTVLIFGKSPVSKPEPYMRDTIQCSAVEKEYHEWQQAVEPFQYLIHHITKQHDTVLDPFVCTGTVALASLMENRKCIGIDLNEKMIRVAQGRIQEYVKKSKKAA